MLMRHVDCTVCSARAKASLYSNSPRRAPYLMADKAVTAQEPAKTLAKKRQRKQPAASKKGKRRKRTEEAAGRSSSRKPTKKKKTSKKPAKSKKENSQTRNLNEEERKKVSEKIDREEVILHVHKTVSDSLLPDLFPD